MNEASSLARKATAAAISSASANRPIGTCTGLCGGAVATTNPVSTSSWSTLARRLRVAPVACWSSSRLASSTSCNAAMTVVPKRDHQLREELLREPADAQQARQRRHEDAFIANEHAQHGEGVRLGGIREDPWRASTRVLDEPREGVPVEILHGCLENRLVIPARLACTLPQAVDLIRGHPLVGCHPPGHRNRRRGPSSSRSRGVARAVAARPPRPPG
jgi:hypothetical protein